MTDRDVVELIAKESGVPIESVSFDRDQPVYSRGRFYKSSLGDVLDDIARRRLSGTEWWLSDQGLNMISSVIPDRCAIFDELAGPPRVETPKRTRPGDPRVQRIKKKVRKLRKEGLDYSEICTRLGSGERPPRARLERSPLAEGIPETHGCCHEVAF
jgi:hypothetical protein